MTVGLRRTEDILTASTGRWADRVAVIDRDGAYSYRDVNAAAHQIASLLSSAQIPPHSVVGIAVDDARDFLAALFGILLSDCVAIPVPQVLTAPERERIVQDTGVAWLLESSDVTTRDGEQKAGETMLFASTVVRLVRTAASGRGVAESFPNAAIIRQTSGTTARSKGVLLDHEGVLERVSVSERLLEVTLGDVVLVALPITYHFIASALSCMQAGATIVDCGALSALEMLELGETYGATVVYGSPLHYEALSREQSTHRLPKLRSAVSASAPLSKEVADAFYDKFHCRLTQVYGIIEVGLPLWNRSGVADPSLLGYCVAPYECKLVGDDGCEMVGAAVGELLVRGPGLFAGYILSGGVSEVHRAGAWFCTGDIVERDGADLMTYRGRKKSVITCGSDRIFPEEVEAVLRRAPDIQEVRVVGEPHPVLGHVVIAEVVTESGHAGAIEQWRSLCGGELSEFKIPHEFRIVSSLPSTGSGKLVRHAGVG